MPHEDVIDVASFNTDGKKIVTIDRSRICREWHNLYQKNNLIFKKLGPQVLQTFFSPNGKILLAHSDYT